MKKKIEFKNVEKIDESVFKIEPSIDIDKMLQNGKIVFTTRHPEGVKRAVRVFSTIPEIKIDEEKVKEIADQIEFNAESKELIIDGQGRRKALELLDKKHQDWINNKNKNK